MVRLTSPKASSFACGIACLLSAVGLTFGATSTRAGAPKAEPEAEVSPALSIDVEIPRLSVSEYHRPYVAIWLEDESRKVAANLSVWYQLDESGEGHGTKWLPDLRQWWRRIGRELDMPVDGVSGATKPVGKHRLTFNGDRLKGLKPGRHELIVEAAREVGGREVVKFAFDWPVKQSTKIKTSGKTEIGQVMVELNLH